MSDDVDQGAGPVSLWRDPRSLLALVAFLMAVGALFATGWVI